METKKIIAKFLLATIFAQFFVLPTTNFAQEINKARKRVAAPTFSYDQYLQNTQRKTAKNTKEKPNPYDRLQASKAFDLLSSAGKRAVAMQTNQPKIVSRNLQKNAFADINSMPVLSPLAQGDDNILVNNPALDPGLTQSESSIAANGNVVIVSYNSSFATDSDFNFSGYSRSTDGGQTFTQGFIPNLPNGFNLGDGVVDFGPNGEIYYSTLTILREDTGIKSIIGVAKSTDQGLTFSTPVDATTTAANNLDFQDKEWLTVDKNANSPFKGNVYVSWTTFSDNISISFARSTDGGQTYSAPVSLSQGDGSFGVQGSMPAVAPNGDLYVAYYRIGDFDNLSSPDLFTISLVKSTDGGRTFSPSKAIAPIYNSSNLTGGIDGTGVRSNSFPSIAVDQRGTVHVVYAATPANNVTATGTDRSDIFYVRSTNSGQTFSSPIKINDDKTSTSQSNPSIAISADGTVGIRWWDRRNDPILDSLTDVYMATSTNGGASFGSNFQVSNHNWSFGAIESNIAFGYHGDYDTITTFGNDFYVAWSDERNENPDVYFSKLPSNFNPKTPDFSLSPKNFYNVVVAGQKATFDLQLFDRNGFPDNISLSATSSVSGLSYGFSRPTTRTGQPVTLTVSASNTVAPGTYLIVVSATSGSKVRRTNLRLTVFPPNHSLGLPTNISNNRGETNFVTDGVKIDSKGTIHIAFVDNSNSNIPRDSIIEFEAKTFYRQSTDGGKTFSTPVSIVPAQSRFLANAPSLAIDEKNNIIYAAFPGAVAAPNRVENGIFLVKSTDGGKTFSVPVKVVGESMLNDCSPSSVAIVVDKLGNLVIATPTAFCLVQSDDEIDEIDQRVGVFVVRSKNKGATFSKPERVSLQGESGFLFTPIKLVFDEQNNSTYLAYPYQVLREDFDVDLGIKLAVDSGNGFGTPNQVFLNQGVFDIIDNNREPILTGFSQIGLGIKGSEAYVSFELMATPLDFSAPKFNTHLAKSTDNGRTFGTPINVSNDNNTALIGYTNVFPSANGTINVAWRSRNGLLLSASQDGGQTFGNSVSISGNTGIFTRSLDTLTVVSNNSGRTYALWNGAISAQFETYLSILPPVLRKEFKLFPTKTKSPF